MNAGIILVVRRTIRAQVEVVFAAWTRPEHLLAWWGPRPVTCKSAEVDLRAGGHYRIVNAMPDGGTLTIEGDFEEVTIPSRLVYTWQVGNEESSRVTVRFEARGDATEVVIAHEQIPSEQIRQSHESGWVGCLDGLERFFTKA